jgi:hypothetical protein
MILMLEKISVKTTTVIFLLCTVILALCACVNAVDIEKFLKDPQVQKVIDASKPTVYIHVDSDNYDNLVKGNGKISGLISGKYYILVEYDKEMVFRKILYIKADGNPIGNLGGIDRLTGTQVVGLQNFYTYKVKLAQPFEDGTYKYFAFGETEEIEADAKDGKISTVARTGTGSYYLEVSPVIDANNDYEVMMVPDIASWNSSRVSAYYKESPANNYNPYNTNLLASQYRKYTPNNISTKDIGIYQYRSSIVNNIKTGSGSINLLDRSIIELLNVSTTQIDYVFVDCKDDTIKKFTFLSVKIKQTPIVDDFTIDNLSQEYGSVTPVTITPNEGKSTGEIKIYYNGSDTLPTTLGNYVVTFDVEESEDFTAATGLDGGILTISKGNPKASDFVIDNLTQTVVSITPVTVTPKEGKSLGDIKIYYDGDDTLPSVEGIYEVTFDVAEDENWNEAIGLIAGTLTINKLNNIQISVSLTGFSKYKPDIKVTPDSFDRDAEIPIKFTLEITNAEEYDDNDIKWYKDDNPNLDDNLLLGSGATLPLSLNKDNYNWWQEGKHYIYLIIKDTNNVPQSGFVIITCNWQ